MRLRCINRELLIYDLYLDIANKKTDNFAWGWKFSRTPKSKNCNCFIRAHVAFSLLYIFNSTSKGITLMLKYWLYTRILTNEYSYYRNIDFDLKMFARNHQYCQKINFKLVMLKYFWIFLLNFRVICHNEKNIILRW